MPSLGNPLRKSSRHDTGRSRNPSKEKSPALKTIGSSPKQNSCRDNRDSPTRATPRKGSSKLPKISQEPQIVPYQGPPQKFQNSATMFRESDIEPPKRLKGSPRYPSAQKNQKSTKLAEVPPQMALKAVYEAAPKPRSHARHSPKLSLYDEKKLLGLERDKRTLEITSGRADLSPMKRKNIISQLEQLENRIQNFTVNKTNPVLGGIGSQFLSSQQLSYLLGTPETLLEEAETSSDGDLDTVETLQTTQGTSTSFLPLTNDRTMGSTGTSLYKDVYTRLDKFKNECV